MLLSPPSVLLSLGSNIEPAANLVRALEELFVAVEVVGASRVFETDAVAERPMEPFLNAAVEVLTELDPLMLKFGLLREIEARLGRRRSADRNAPRTIDIDIALFGDLVVCDAVAGLEIPDPEILVRAHVAVPLADLAPARMHPVDRCSLAEIAGRFESEGGIRPATGAEALVLRLAELEADAGASID